MITHPSHAVLARCVLGLALASGLACSAQGGGRTVDLSEDLSNSVLQAETSRLDVGTAEARVHLLDGWSIDELWEGGESFAWGLGNSSTVTVTHFGTEAVRLRFRVRSMFGLPAAQWIETSLNGAVLGRTSVLDDAFHEYTVEIPGTAWHTGDNLLLFRYAGAGSGGVPAEKRALAVAWDWLAIGDAPDSPDVTAAVRQPLGIAVPFRHRLDYFYELRPGSRLQWQGIAPWRTEKAARAALVILVESDSGSALVARVDASSFAQPGEFLLPITAQGLARISFLALGDAGPTGEIAGLTLQHPRLLGVAEEEPPPPLDSRTADVRPNVVLYLVDTLRADRLGVYGYARSTSPSLDAFAADATVFSRAYAQSGWTRTSIASILTGLPPRAHGVLGRMHALDQSLPMLPERLRELGYATFGVTTNANVAPEFGFGRGFDEYLDVSLDESQGPKGCEVEFRPSDRVNVEFLKWLDARRRKPFFAFLHTLYPHAPYVPTEDHRRSLAPRAWRDLCVPTDVEISAAMTRDPRRSLADVRQDLSALYDAEVADADAQFGELLTALRRRGVYENTLIIFLSDHGEEFLDHGYWAHGHSLFQEAIHVPLVVRFPGGLGAGKRVSTAAQHLDVLPTVLQAAGDRGSAPSGDLRQMVDGPGRDRPILSELDLGGTTISSLVEGNYHLLEWSRPNVRFELFDRLSDSAETASFAVRRDYRFEYMRHRLGMIESTLPVFAPRSMELTPELEERLRALGYLPGGHP